MAFGVPYPDDHALTVNVINAKIHDLRDSHATCVHQCQTHAGDGALDLIQQAPHFITAQDNRQSFVCLCAFEMQQFPLPPQCSAIQELDRVEINVERTLGDLFGLDQIEQVLPDLSFSDSAERAVVILG